MSTDAHRTGGTPDRPTASGAPLVSIVVPTRNRAPQLRDLLVALSQQTFSLARAEIIVVDNESDDETRDVVLRATEGGLPVRYVRKENDGPASSRNRGAELAAGEFVAFTDSDCLPEPGWLSSGVGAFTAGTGLVCGPILPIPVGRDAPFFVHQINAVDREEGLYPTANIFYRRDVFLRLGGFDERSRTYAWGQPIGGDDTEMAWRVKRAGYASAFAPAAAVRHQASPVSAREYLLNAVQAQVVPRMVAVAPELRTMCFYRRFFLKRQTAQFYLFIAAALCGWRRRPALLLALPWLRSVMPILRIDAWPPGRWARAALRLAIQVESSLLLVLSLWYGSVRHRRIVL